jgi:hypothetical protein
MLKLLCCGSSKKEVLESEKYELQLLLLGEIVLINNNMLSWFCYTGPDQLGKLNVLQHIAAYQNQFTDQ